MAILLQCKVQILCILISDAFLQANYLGGIGINEAPIQMAIASGNLMQWTNNDGGNQGLMPIVPPSAPSYHNPSQMTAQGL